LTDKEIVLVGLIVDVDGKLIGEQIIHSTISVIAQDDLFQTSFSREDIAWNGKRKK